MNYIVDLLAGFVGGCIALFGKETVTRVKLLAKKELRHTMITDEQMKGIAKEALKQGVSLPPEAKKFLSNPPDKVETAEEKARKEFMQAQLDEVLDERLKTAAGTEKMLSYAAAYLHDRAASKSVTEVDWRMLERIARICRAGSVSLERARAVQEEALQNFISGEAPEKGT
jgi:hypothetical protein